MFSLSNNANNACAPNSEAANARKRSFGATGGYLHEPKRRNISVCVQPASTPLLEVLNTADPSSIAQLGHWNQQLSQLVLDIEQRLSSLLPDLQAGSAQLPTQPTALSPLIAHSENAAVGISKKLPCCDCPSDVKYSVRRVYMLGCPKTKTRPVKQNLRQYGIDSSMIIHSHPIDSRFDEFLIESRYAEAFMRAMLDAQAVNVIGTDITSVIERAVSLGEHEPSFERYSKQLLSAYKIARGTKQFRSKEFFEDYALELGISLV